MVKVGIKLIRDLLKIVYDRPWGLTQVVNGQGGCRGEPGSN